MTERLVAFERYHEHYVPRLRAAGVGGADAEESILLGWSIIHVHQACYGTGSSVPVSFEVLPPGAERIMAGCSGRRFDGRAQGYAVYPVGLAALTRERMLAYGNLVPSDVLRFSVAVHEVRHHVQDREAATLRMFDRNRLLGSWSDMQAAIVAINMDLQFREDEARLRAAGASDREIGWKFGPVEFDAEVVERLSIHRAPALTDPARLAAFVRMDSPQLS